MISAADHRGFCLIMAVMQLELAGIRNTDADHAASHLGKAIGLATVLRGTSRHAAR